MQHVDEFVESVRVSMVNGTDDEVNSAIENAYDKHIVTNKLPKADFLEWLAEKNIGVFRATVSHLFTPINWSQVNVRILWGIKNLATGNMLTLERDDDRDLYHLTESTVDNQSVMACTPMLTGKQEDAEMFIKMLEDVPMDAPIGVGESLVTLELDQRINVANLVVSEVKIIC